MLSVLSQIPQDSLAGASGWTTAGLLAAVLGWIAFRHLPGKDKQLEKFIEDKDRQISKLIEDCDTHNEKVVATFASELKTQREQYQTSLEFLSQQHERHVSLLAEAIRQEFKSIRLERDSNEHARSPGV